jgi:hypothetical protein
VLAAALLATLAGFLLPALLLLTGLLLARILLTGVLLAWVVLLLLRVLVLLLRVLVLILVRHFALSPGRRARETNDGTGKSFQENAFCRRNRNSYTCLYARS